MESTYNPSRIGAAKRARRASTAVNHAVTSKAAGAVHLAITPAGAAGSVSKGDATAAVGMSPAADAASTIRGTVTSVQDGKQDKFSK